MESRRKEVKSHSHTQFYVLADQGSLPTWNETHSFEIEDRHDSGLEDLVIEIFAARHELNELLGVAK